MKRLPKKHATPIAAEEGGAAEVRGGMQEQQEQLAGRLDPPKKAPMYLSVPEVSSSSEPV